MTRVMMVHGIAQGGKDPDKLRDEWLAALAVGYRSAGRQWPPVASFDLPFYGDRLDEFVAGEEHRSDAELTAKGPGDAETEFEQFLRQTLIEMQERRSDLSEEAITAALGSEDVGEKGPLNWKWVHRIAQTIDSRWHGAAEFGIKKLLAEVHMYVHVPRAQRVIDEMVSACLTDEPTVLVGHSLGSVVAYNVSRVSNFDFVRFVTVGSPLGIRTVNAELGVPSNRATHGWINAYDPQDIVALCPLDPQYFYTHPAITNVGDVENGTSNQHGIVGYLDDPRVAVAIDDAIQGSVAT